MRDESYGFENTKVRLEEIVTQVRKKDVSLEKSLDLLEEGVRLANQCTELIDKADWQEAGRPSTDEVELDEEAASAQVDVAEQSLADDADSDDAEDAVAGDDSTA